MDNKINKSYLTEEAKSDINEMLGNNESGGDNIGRLVKIINTNVLIGTINSGISYREVEPSILSPTLKPNTEYTLIYKINDIVSEHDIITSGTGSMGMLVTGSDGKLPQWSLYNEVVKVKTYAETEHNNIEITITLYIFEGALM